MKKFKTIRFLFHLFISTLIVLPSCKYEDGPFISFYMKKTRLVGHWDFSRVYLNGENITAQYEDHVIQFKESGICIWYLDINQSNYYNPNLDYTEIGSWDFQDNKEELFLDFYTEGHEPFTQTWEIKELRFHDMKLERWEGDDKIIWELDKIN